MNFSSSKNAKKRQNIKKIMKDGDLVVIYERHDSLTHIYLTASKIHNMKFGSFYHDDMIGKPFGSKIYSRTSQGWLYVLEPTPELWGLAVNTRTQIVNELDSSVCVMNMEIHPGCRVIESGTGSGCMTLSLARAVAPNGHIFTFEYNSFRAEAAKEEFEKFGVNELITVECRDVCGKYRPSELGFGNISPQSIDSVFLDLPEPWLVLDHALLLLKPGKVICSYSPCIEQVLRTCDRLRSLGCLCIRMVEARNRPHDARSRANKFSFISDLVPLIRYVELERLYLGEEGEQPLTSIEEKLQDEHEGAKRQCRESGSGQICGKGEVEGSGGGGGGDLLIEFEATHEVAEERKTEPLTSRSQSNAGKYFLPSTRTLVARPATTMKGHSAFLTFAIAPPTLSPSLQYLVTPTTNSPP